MKAVLKHYVGLILSALRRTLPAPMLPLVARALATMGFRGSSRRFYEAYLGKRPDDAVWLLRYADDLRDAGFFAAAIQIYQRLQRITPADPRVWFALGRLYVLNKEVKQASVAFQRAYELGEHKQAAEWLSRWGFRLNENGVLGKPTKHRDPAWFFDVTDVLQYLDMHTTVSGIQRVVISLFESIEQSPKSYDGRRQFCWLDPESRRFRVVYAESFRQVLSVLAEENPSRLSLGAAIRSCRTGPIVDFVQRDTVVILGAFWNNQFYPRVLLAHRKRGVQFCVYIYDLLPVTNSAFFEPELVETFNKEIYETLNIVDYCLAISEYTRDQVRLFAKRHLGRDLPVTTVFLAHQLHSNEKHNAPGDIARVCQKKFVLCVGTIEIRKNHSLLIDVWRELVLERGTRDIPDLVIVGRWGWRVERLREDLIASGFVDGKITVLTGVGDADLAMLYKAAMFTVFPSIAEGWGLPIGESLAHGTPCIASSTTSMPEVGGSFVTYIDPNDKQSAKTAITRALDDPLALSEWRRRIKAEFKPRTWADVGRDMEAALLDLSGSTAVHDTYATVEPVKVYRPIDQRSGPGKTALRHQTLALCQVVGWQSDGFGGGWAVQRDPVLRFGVVGVTALVRVRVAVCLELPRVQDPVHARVVTVDGPVEFFIHGGAARWYFFDVAARGDGKVEIGFAVDGPVLQSDPSEPRFFRISGLCVAVTADVQQRLAMIEVLLQEAQWAEINGRGSL